MEDLLAFHLLILPFLSRQSKGFSPYCLGLASSKNGLDSICVVGLASTSRGCLSAPRNQGLQFQMEPDREMTISGSPSCPMPSGGRSSGEANLVCLGNTADVPVYRMQSQKSIVLFLQLLQFTPTKLC